MGLGTQRLLIGVDGFLVTRCLGQQRTHQCKIRGPQTVLSALQPVQRFSALTLIRKQPPRCDGHCAIRLIGVARFQQRKRTTGASACPSLSASRPMMLASASPMSRASSSVRP